MRRPFHDRARVRAQSGTTLVEVMVALVVLAVLALACAASLQYARSTTVLQRDRRTALELANGRLEALRGAIYNNVKPAALNYNVNYIRQTGTTWVVSSVATNESVKVNYRTRPMTTTVRYVDVDGTPASYDALRFNVTVQYGSSTNNEVELETLRGP